MKPDESDITTLFAQQFVQYSVPHYQRPQVWKKTDHWEPLWADIEAKANAWYLGEEIPNQHYLGAIVLAKRPKLGVRGMDRHLVIDGQQRLSTMQYVLKALSMQTNEHAWEDGTQSIARELYNADTRSMDRPDVQTYKLWPTFRDRPHHIQVMKAASKADLVTAYPNHFTRAGSLYVDETKHPRPLQCTIFFYDKIASWLEELEGEDSKVNGLEAVRRAITKSLQLIVLWLEPQDDPQVIFECLNGRGAPLRQTDLIKNFVFMAAEAEPGGDEIAEDGPLFKAWARLDEDIWQAVLSRGKMKQTRLEWLINYSMQAETGNNLDTSSLYNSYQNWIKAGVKAKQPLSAMNQVSLLLAHAQALEHFINETPTEPIGRLGKIAQALDSTTITPLALAIAIARNCSAEVQNEMFESLSSYLIRRLTCGETNKAYNNTFMAVLRELRKNGFTPAVLNSYLSKPDGSTVYWPSDVKFSEALQTSRLYAPGSALCRILLAAAANRIGAAGSSEVNWSPNWAGLHLEHLLPQMWITHWPLSDGSKVTQEELERAPMLPKTEDEAGLRVARILDRQRVVNRLGNLTILNSYINMDIKNYEWMRKRTTIAASTQLRMNYDITQQETWDENSIRTRGETLAKILCQVFVGPPKPILPATA